MSWIAQGFNLVVDTIKAILNPVELLAKYLNPLSEDFIFTKLFKNVAGLFDAFDINGDKFIFSDFFSNIGKMLSWLNPFSDNFFLKGLFNILNPLSDDFFLKKLFNWLNPFSDDFIGKKIVELLSNALQALFVPSEERINAVYNTVANKFEFIESIKIAINSTQDLLNNTGNSPKLTLNVGATKYTEAQNVTVLDLAWYSQFKPYGDLVLTGFIYLFFLWRLFISLPKIIHGVGGAIESDFMLNDIEHFQENSKDGGVYKK